VTKKRKPARPGPGHNEGRGEATVGSGRLFGWLGVGVVVLATAFLYAPAVNHQFTNWDDDRQITANPNIRDLSPQGVQKMFSSFPVSLYQPLTSLGFAVEYRLFGLNPRVFHTVNILLHLVNIVLAYVLVRSLAQNRAIGIAAAALFAVHPLQVEAVAWASSLSIVLSSAFYLGTLIAYAAYVRSGRGRYFAGALVLFLLALLAKTTAATLPLVLIVLDLYWRRSLWRPHESRTNTRVAASRPKALGMAHAWMAHSGKSVDWRIVCEKIPFFLLSAVFGGITMFARSGVSHVQDFALKFSLVQRVCIVCYSCLWYVGKLVLPVSLSVFYPFPHKTNGWLPLAFYLAPVVLMGLAVGIWYAGRHRRLLAFAALFMLASLVLVVQIIPISELMVCDRYAYIPCIGLFLLVGTLGHQIGSRSALRMRAMLAGLVLVLAVLSGATYRRVGVWRDSLTLWNDVISKRQDLWVAYLNRGVAESERGDRRAALADFDAALRLNPKADKALNSRAVCHTYLGDRSAALRDFDSAIRLNPDSSYLVNRGILKRDTGDFDGALKDFSAVIALNRRHAGAFCERADTWRMLGDWARARADYTSVLRLNPAHAYATFFLGAVLLEKGESARAVTALNKALALGWKDPASAYILLAKAYRQMGRTDLADDALRHAQQMGLDGAQTRRREDNPQR
jgi:tetratricopeptide (TPR) repeat protein